jgi:hypothetical protein
LKTVRTELLHKATCPNCWSEFLVENVKWVAAHEELLGDYRLGPDYQQRFIPTRFDVSGNAIDVKGMSCQELACPECHLKVPRSVLVFRPFFLSIAGTPSCGKSFFLAAMAWQLRKTLPSKFNLQVSDSDGESNRILNDYEEQLFFNSDTSDLAKLAKTDVVGDWYSTVQYDEQTISYPKPFYFDLKPSEGHNRVEDARKLSRLICLYDNAGESFLPGADSVTSPVTRHLGLAEAWVFCFDPTQDPRIRRALKGQSKDYQVVDGPVTARQESVLNEMVNRIRRHSGVGMKNKSDKPLMVACTKFDAWQKLLGDLPSPWEYSKKHSTCLLNMTNIENASKRLEKLLQSHCPEVVAAAKSISSCVYFLPLSATGTAPVKDTKTNDYMIRTDLIDPIWCEVPMLLAMAYRAPNLVFSGRAKSVSAKKK